MTTLAPCKEDRAPELAAAKAAQMVEVVEAIDVAATEQKRWPLGTRKLKALMLDVAYHESGLCMRITRGEFKPFEADPDGHGVARAHSNWQLHEAATSSREAWLAARTDVHVAAREAARALTRAYWTAQSKMLCRGVEPIAATLSVFAGRRCDVAWKGLSARLATFQNLMSTPLPKP